MWRDYPFNTLAINIAQKSSVLLVVFISVALAMGSVNLVLDFLWRNNGPHSVKTRHSLHFLTSSFIIFATATALLEVLLFIVSLYESSGSVGEVIFYEVRS